MIHWEDDGLGAASSMVAKLESGRVALLTEHAHLIERRRAKGPLVEVEARDVAEIGVASFVDEGRGAFQLSREDVDWIAPVDKAYAADRLRSWALHVAKRDRCGNGEPLR